MSYSRFLNSVYVRLIAEIFCDDFYFEHQRSRRPRERRARPHRSASTGGAVGRQWMFAGQRPSERGMQMPQQFISSGAQGGEHGPQSTEPPHPSGMTPQRARAFRQVRGTQGGPASTTGATPASPAAGAGSERADTQERPRRPRLSSREANTRAGPAGRERFMTRQVSTCLPAWVSGFSGRTRGEAHPPEVSAQHRLCRAWPSTFLLTVVDQHQSGRQWGRQRVPPSPPPSAPPPNS